jgi:hypothetical protein
MRLAISGTTYHCRSPISARAMIGIVTRLRMPQIDSAEAGASRGVMK